MKLDARYDNDSCVLEEARKLHDLGDMPDPEVRLWLCCHLAESRRMRDALDQDAERRSMPNGANPYEHLRAVRDEQEAERGALRTTIRTLAGMLP